MNSGINTSVCVGRRGGGRGGGEEDFTINIPTILNILGVQYILSSLDTVFK